MQKPSTQGVGGAAVHVVPAFVPTKLPPEVKVIPASEGAPIEPGPLCRFAKALKIDISLCGITGGEDREGWDGYCADGPHIRELPDAYESAEDCARAALTELRNKINEVL